MDISFKIVNPIVGKDIPLPSYTTSGAAGIDLAAALNEPVVLRPGECMLIPTGIAVEIPSIEIVGLIFPRSGLATKHGISLANAVGVIDSDYKGEIFCPVQNNGPSTYEIKPGDRISQLVFVPVIKARIGFVEELTRTERGTGGFGSTGR